MKEMPPVRRTLGILLSIHPDDRLNLQVEPLISAALQQGVVTHVYLSDEAVLGADRKLWRDFQSRGLRLFVCALSARNRGMELDQDVVYSGLGKLNEIMVHSERFLSFN